MSNIGLEMSPESKVPQGPRHRGMSWLAILLSINLLNLLLDLKDELGLTYIFISHDLEVVRFMSTRVLVMYLGEVVETGSAEALAQSPRHPYTQALFASAPSMDPDRRMEQPPIMGDPPNPIDPPSGCRFRTRCPFAMPRCAEAPPPFRPVDAGHEVACYLYELEPATRG